MIFGRNVIKYYFKYWYFFIIGIVALLLVDYFQLFIPEIYGEIIDAVDKGVLTSKILQSDLLKMLGILVIMIFGRFVWRHFLFGIGMRVEADIRDRMFKHSEKLSQSFYSNHKTGALMALFTNDLQSIRHAFGSGTLMLFDASFLFVLAFIKMWKLDKNLAFLSLIPLILLALAGGIIGKFLQKKYKERQEVYSNLSDFVQENFSGISVIKAFVKEALELRAFSKINKQNSLKNIEYVRLATLFNIFLSLTLSSVIVIIFGYGSYLVYQNKMNGIGDFSIGNLTEFVTYFVTLVWPMQAISSLINLRSQAKASLIRVNELLDAEIEIKDTEIIYTEEILGNITLNNLEFKYPDSHENVLKNISFDIKRGQMIGIIGRTGCGKSTIVDLLLRTYNVNMGQIMIDDIDIMKIPLKKLRTSIGYVPQDNFLYSDTIKNNISFAFAEEIDDNIIIQSAEYSDVHSNIIDFENKYETILGERGVTLSGGQKQRVSIARALIKNPPILIFDDSVSAVDTKTEEKILTNLKQIRKNKTTILIANRISTVKDLDLIILLEDGQLLAKGTHKELISSCEEYKKMVEMQTLEEEVDGAIYE